MRQCLMIAVALGVLVTPGLTVAEVKERRRDVFTLVFEAPVAAEADVVRAKVLAAGDWWADEAALSGQGSNMRLEAQRGGCLCETLSGGPFVHGIVGEASTRRIRVYAPLGPLTERGVDEAWLAFSWPEGRDGVRRLRMTYEVRGFQAGRLAEATDAHLAPSFARLAAQLGAP